MSSSSIVVRCKYQTCNDLKHSISKTISYIGDKKKADSSSIDEYNIINDYDSLADKESFFLESKETFYWNMNGDTNPKKELNNIKDLDSKGILWSLVVSFPPNFAMDNGLITKLDYYHLTNSFLPNFLTGMGLDLNNITWFASLHRNTNNPHIHINFFEHKKTLTNPKIPYSCIYKLKSNIANYLINNEEFYKLRDKELKDIINLISFEDLNKIKNQKLFSDSYRKGLNKMLIRFYDTLPKKGRLQYNSKDMSIYKKDLDQIISYILMHDSVKYDYANYLKLLNEHQRQLNQIYGSSSENKNHQYYENQLNKLYSKIGNEILTNYKIYNSTNIIEKETSFIKKNINDFNFRSRSDYVTDESKKKIALGLYKICMISGLNYNQTKKVISDWIKKSKYDLDVNSLLETMIGTNTDMTTTELYNVLNKLGYDYDRYKKIKDKNFYKELNYKRFVNRAFNHLMHEYEKEQKQIERDLKYELEGF